MKKSILILFVFLTNFAFSQDGFEEWNKNYHYKEAEQIIQDEIEYAKEVEKDTSQGHYYIAIEKFRFLAEFTGKKRKVDQENLNSMKRAFKIRNGNNEILNGLVSFEFEFNVGKSNIWMSIQNQLIEPFESEVNKGDKVLLYCLFSNEHLYEGGIINTFLISEFTTKWE